MQGLKKELPQPDLLIAFEAAARHASFTLAAEELNVTQSAVSQQIRNLEAGLGVTLFERGHRFVRLTPGGREFHNSVSVALTHLLNAANRLRISEAGPSLNIATDESLAALWLAPRLQGFQARHPGLTLRLVASDRVADCFHESIDLAVVHGDGGWRRYDCQTFFEEEVFPVCSPGFLARHPDVADLEALSGAALLDLEYAQWSWMNWNIWFTEKGLGPPAEQRTLICNSYPLLLDLARRGQGVALGWRYFVDDDLARGSLVRPVEASVETRFAYYLIRQFNRELSPEAEAFRAWLLAERDDERVGHKSL